MPFFNSASILYNNFDTTQTLEWTMKHKKLIKYITNDRNSPFKIARSYMRSEHWINMDFAGKHYYDIHRILLSSIGLWPYQDLKRKKIQRFISSVILMSSVIVQVNHPFKRNLTEQWSCSISSGSSLFLVNEVLDDWIQSGSSTQGSVICNTLCSVRPEVFFF